MHWLDLLKRPIPGGTLALDVMRRIYSALGINTLDETLDILVPNWPVINAAAPEAHAFRNEVLISQAGSHTAAGGQLPTLHLLNNDPSEVWVIYQLVISVPVAQTVRVNITSPNPGALTPVGADGEFADTRLGDSPSRRQLFSEATAVSIQAEELDVDLAANSPLVVPMRVILATVARGGNPAPQRALSVQGQTVAQTVRASYHFYRLGYVGFKERHLTP